MNSKYVVLESDRLFIRQTHLNDAFEIADYFSRNRQFHKPFDPIRPDYFFTEKNWTECVVSDLHKFRNDESLRLFLFEKESPYRIIGMIHFSGFIRGAFQAAYLGYSLDEKCQRKGFMHESLSVAISYMFQTLNFHRIMANCMTTNERSLSVLKKLNFDIEGTAKDYLFINGKWEDHILTALANKEHLFNQ